MLTQDQKTEQQNERGAALLLTLILMLVLSLLTVSMFELLKASTQIAGNHRLELRTLYIADAGIEDTIKSLRSDSDLRESTGTVALFTDQPFADGKYTVIVKYDGEPDNPSVAYKKEITSTGTIGEFKRAVKVLVNVLENGEDDYSVATTSWKLVAP